MIEECLGIKHLANQATGYSYFLLTLRATSLLCCLCCLCSHSSTSTAQQSTARHSSCGLVVPYNGPYSLGPPGLVASGPGTGADTGPGTTARGRDLLQPTLCILQSNFCTATATCYMLQQTTLDSASSRVCLLGNTIADRYELRSW